MNCDKNRIITFHPQKKKNLWRAQVVITMGKEKFEKIISSKLD